jgi:4a-hydroxytetrahydrobiopterin dehydratase
MAVPVLTVDAIQKNLADLPEWTLEGEEIVRLFEFGDFREAMSFVNSVAMVAERAAHHPDIDIRYNKVKLALASHDAGGITETDFAVAREIGGVL